MFNNRNFIQKLKFCSKIEILFKNVNFVQKLKVCSKIESLFKNLKFISLAIKLLFIYYYYFIKINSVCQFRCEFCMINVHKKCMSSVNKNCQVHRTEKRGRIRLELEICENEKIKFKIYEAANLRSMDLNGTSDAYVTDFWIITKKFYTIFLKRIF